MHRKLRAAGVDAELHVFEAMPHGGFFGAPEDVEIGAEVRRFIASHLPVPNPETEERAMRVVVYDFMSLDGVVQSPAGARRTPTRGSPTAAGRCRTSTWR